MFAETESEKKRKDTATSEREGQTIKCRRKHRNDCVYSLAGGFVAGAFGKPNRAGPVGPITLLNDPFFLFPEPAELATYSHGARHERIHEANR